MAFSNGADNVVADEAQSYTAGSDAGENYDASAYCFHVFICKVCSWVSYLLDLEQYFIDPATMGHYAPNGREGVT